MGFRIPLWARFALLFGLGLLLVPGVSSWLRGAAVAPLLSPLPQDPQIQVYFNQSQSASYREPYRDQSRLGDNLEQVMVDAIQSAKVSVDLAVQEVRLPRVADALKAKHQAGVRVRVVIENTYNRTLSDAEQQVDQMEERDRTRYEEYRQLVDENQDGQISADEVNRGDAIALLKTAEVPLIDDRADGSRGSDLMHHKFVVIDGKTVVTGSVNLSPSEVHGDFLSPASRGNANHLLKIQSRALAKLFTEEFDLLWGDGPNGRPDSRFGLKKPYRLPQRVQISPTSAITIQFSPLSAAQPWEYSTNGLISRTLDTATRSIDLALFVFTDQSLSNTLETRHQKGVRLRGLIDPNFAYRSYSEALDMMGIRLPDNRCRYEKGNRVWQRAIATIGIPTLPEGDLLHHKFALLDDRTVITGSHNWSAAANHKNDETLLIIKNATVAAHFKREFDRLYQDAVLGIPDWLQKKVQRDTARCGFK
jgi:phosphatidylserine/phosphatidylglycerophosphate/cardiolipin synthase-like enzyme